MFPKRLFDAVLLRGLKPSGRAHASVVLHIVSPFEEACQNLDPPTNNNVFPSTELYILHLCLPLCLNPQWLDIFKRIPNHTALQTASKSLCFSVTKR